MTSCVIWSLAMRRGRGDRRLAVLESMVAWIGENRVSLEARGLFVAVAPPRADRSKQAVSLSVDSGTGSVS
jgi:hypothetical protein